MKFNIAILPGDGIGPEISVQGVDVMNAVCEKFIVINLFPYIYFFEKPSLLLKLLHHNLKLNINYQTKVLSFL